VDFQYREHAIRPQHAHCIFKLLALFLYYHQSNVKIPFSVFSVAHALLLILAV
jgi:hypothetical protein